jgi:adenosine deaminase
MIHVLADTAACRRIAYESVEDAGREGIDYLELRFSPGYMARPHGLDAAAVVDAVIDGVRAGERDFGVKTRLIGILSRTFGPDDCRAELEALLAHRAAIHALDLAGDEARWPGELFHDHFRRGRDAGWQITVHAGEAGGAENVRYAVEHLGATRIGHGIRAVRDPAVLRLLADRGIGLEINLTSNLQTATVGSLAEHPLKFFLDRGFLASINTDDPVISGIDLRHEFEVAAIASGLSPGQARKAQENALATAFLTPDERASLLRRAAARRSPA